LEFGILGPLEVRDAGGRVRVPGAKERALLAELVVQAGRVVAADRLVEDLWGQRLPGNPANTLQGRVSALWRALGPAGAKLVVTRPPGYVLEVDPGQVDVARFEGWSPRPWPWVRPRHRRPAGCWPQRWGCGGGGLGRVRRPALGPD
jgi:DNA-binding SARP family transcriptional activator